MDHSLSWQLISESDFPRVNQIGDFAHPFLFERPEVLAEKMRFLPAACQKLVKNEEIVGYGIAHPWVSFHIPPLNSFLGTLPGKPDCLYIHDVVVLPQARGQHAAGEYIAQMLSVARNAGLPVLALVSVYGTSPMWQRYGFREITDRGLDEKIATYGSTARYMIRDQNA